MKVISVLLTSLVTLSAAAQTPNVKPCFARHTPKTTFDTANRDSRGLADNYFLWDNGGEIRIRFLSGSPQLQKIVREAAAEWEKYANIHFHFVGEGNSHVRILLGNDGNNSQIGLQAFQVPQDDATTILDTAVFSYSPKAKAEKEFRSYALHELGHVLGLLHEHQHPERSFQWDAEVIQQDICNHGCWTEHNHEDIYDAYIRTYDISYANGTKYDAQSIMHYAIPARWTRDKRVFSWNYELSEGDKEIAAILYPKSKQRAKEKVRLQATFHSIKVINDTAQQLYRFQPSMQLAANIPDKLVMVLYFADGDGQYLEDDNDQYSINGVVGLYRYFYSKAGTFSSDDPGFEMSIPYAELRLDGVNKPLMGYIAIYALNDEEGPKRLYGSRELVKIDGL